MNVLIKIIASENTFVDSGNDTQYLVALTGNLAVINKWALGKLAIPNEEQIMSIEYISEISEADATTIVNLGLAERY